ncbi:MAG: YlxR family protein [Bacteroides sp.]|nr:YlxR family protein [Eubacterium sp.]MCM1419738.1 YlxR family protein [Roseburia sp.]MCM1463724.1 YlxR family protein [Bacteroides sp.]
MGKNIPLRKCLGCDEMLGKKGMIRVVRAPDGAISIDETGKKSGRGAYLCRDAECLAKARKKRGLERSLKCAIPPEIYETIEREMKKA